MVRSSLGAFGMDILAHNRSAWNRYVEDGNRWTRPVSPQDVDRARGGELNLLLTPSKPVPADWFPELAAAATLCLAAAGGQQAPLLAAAGAEVTVFDNSPGQLEQDRSVARRDRLPLEVVQGDMADLSCFADGQFDLIFHPCANCFVPDVLPVWRECFRVLRHGGLMLAGFVNPMRYLFDDERQENGNLEIRYSLPYSDLKALPPSDLQAIVDAQQPLEFGHTLEDQIGGQLQAGFLMSGFYEDRYPEDGGDPLSQYLATFIATRSVKP
ncbi:MAG: class I SAM-dependent methyltransferase [Pirellulales bacterium]|nr:class I SAM-dependent methyltransferase [Pirellulales bacterium]